jgi:hypothetical protein
MSDGNEIPLRMDAYYYGFVETGVRVIDEILSAVAVAGKAYHHTESWNEVDPWHGDGKSHVERIHDAATRAAVRVKELESELASATNGVSAPRHFSEEDGHQCL